MIFGFWIHLVGLLDIKIFELFQQVNTSEKILLLSSAISLIVVPVLLCLININYTMGYVKKISELSGEINDSSVFKKVQLKMNE